MWSLKLRAFITSLLKDENGAPMVEFALVLPVLLLIFFGIIQFGFIMFTYNNMVQAAREAARTLAVQETNVTEVQQVALNQMGFFSGLTFTITACEPVVMTPPHGPACAPPLDPASDVSVKITVPFSEAAIVDILGFFSTGDLEATVTMRKEV